VDVLGHSVYIYYVIVHKVQQLNIRTWC